MKYVAPKIEIWEFKVTTICTELGVSGPEGVNGETGTVIEGSGTWD